MLVTVSASTPGEMWLVTLQNLSIKAVLWVVFLESLNLDASVGTLAHETSLVLELACS